MGPWLWWGIEVLDGRYERSNLATLSILRPVLLPKYSKVGIEKIIDGLKKYAAHHLIYGWVFILWEITESLLCHCVNP